MKKFDYYIIKNFLFTFGLTISLILAIAVVFDFSEKIDNFIEEIVKEIKERDKNLKLISS